MKAIISKIGQMFGEGRTFLMRTNILASGIMKVLGLLISLFMVPITLDYVNQTEFGIWLAISSILYWFAFLDVGLGNGMRNYMTIAVSEGRMLDAGRYFTTTMLYLALIFGGAYIIAVVLLPFIHISNLLNTDILPESYLKKVMLVALTATLLTFFLKNIGYIYAAMQRYAVMELLNFLGHLFSFIGIIILTHFTNGSLLYLVSLLTIVPVMVYLVSAWPTFARYPEMKPSIKQIDFSIRKQVLGKGFGFFAIQITSCLVIFGSSSVFISHYCGPDAVTVFNLAFKLFNLLIVAYTIFISPLWNGYTDAYVKGDWEWIRNTYKKSLKVWGLSILAGIVLLFLAEPFFEIWLAKRVEIPFRISFLVLLYVSFFNLNNCATYLINGLNVIRIQIISSIVVTFLYIISVILLGTNLSLEGLILCLVFSYVIMSAVHLYQCHLILTKKATGIWLK